MWCILKVDAEYVARMEDVLDLYAEEPDLKRLVVCFEESPIELIGEARQPIPAAPGRLERYDCENRRNGPPICSSSWTASVLAQIESHCSSHAIDFAVCMRELADDDYQKAERIRVGSTICRPIRPYAR